MGSILSLIGGILLLTKERLAFNLSHFLASFAAGTLLGTAFFDLLPEALKKGGSEVFTWALVGILIFFLLEKFIHVFHHHHEHKSGFAEPTVALVTLGDSLHNFIDGMVIAASFLVATPLGVVTALAVAAHEIPQEIGDFGVLIHKGLRKGQVLLINLVSAASALVGAIVTYFAKDLISVYLPLFLSLAAGFFIYIAASDLIPEIHEEKRLFYSFWETTMLFIGVSLVWLVVQFFG